MMVIKAVSYDKASLKDEVYDNSLKNQTVCVAACHQAMQAVPRRSYDLYSTTTHCRHFLSRGCLICAARGAAKKGPPTPPPLPHSMLPL